MKPLLAALLLLAGCSDEMLEDALRGPQGRCEEAQRVLTSIPDPTTSDRALVAAACAETIL